jgi:hypothetical protein
MQQDEPGVQARPSSLYLPCTCGNLTHDRYIRCCLGKARILLKADRFRLSGRSERLSKEMRQAVLEEDWAKWPPLRLL